MKAFLPVVVAVALIGSATFVQGFWSDRWNEAAARALATQAGNYPDIPREFGDWTSEEAPSDERQLKIAGAHASISRTYTNERTGEKVMVFMILGKSRDVAKHTPDVCYVGSGFRMAHDPRNYRMTTTDGTADFFTSTFSKQQGNYHTNQRIFWAWSTNGNWEAPDIPRLKYGATTAVNKIYLITEMGQETQNPDEAPSVEFAHEFLPLASDVIFHEPPAIDSPPAEGTPVARK